MRAIWRLTVLASLAAAAAPAAAADFSVPVDLGAAAIIQFTIVKSAVGREGRDDYTERPQTMQFREQLTATKGGYHVVQTEGGQGGRVIAFDTDGRLAPVRITNWREIVAPMGRSANAKRLRAMSPEQAGQSQLLQETAIAQAQSAQLDLDKPVTMVRQAYTPQGGAAISQTVRLELKSIDKAAGVAVIDYSADFDPKALPKRVLVRDTPRGKDEVEFTPSMERVTCRYTMDLRTGLAASADCMHRTSFGSDFREESWRLTQVLQKP